MHKPSADLVNILRFKLIRLFCYLGMHCELPMGRKKCTFLRKYFNGSNDGTRLQCNIQNCTSTISDHSTNLQRHLQFHHPDEYTLFMMEKEQNKKTTKAAEKTNRSSTRLKISVMDACVRLVTVHGRPFSLIDDDAFRDIIKMIPVNETETINAHNVRQAVTHKANAIRNAIKDEVRGKLISLKMDTATCMSRSFLGINFQYIGNGKIHLRTIGMIELFQSHTAEYLKQMIMNVCESFGITLKQIYTITVDNGANMIKMVKIIDEDNNDDINKDSDDEDVSTNMESSETSSETINCIDFGVTTIRCAAHTLQLAVNDLLKTKRLTDVITSARHVVRKLRTPLLKYALSTVHLKNAILDCTTRWHSTVDMLERLVELRDFCNNTADKDLELSDLEWEEITGLVNLLKPARIATKRLQSEQLIIGDFYEVWRRCVMETSKINNHFTNDLIQYMESREKLLIINEAFLAGMYMDLRYNVILSQEQLSTAKKFLLNTWKRIGDLQSESVTASTSKQSNDLQDNTSSENVIEEDDPFELLLRNAESTRILGQTSTIVTSYKLENDLDGLLREPRLQRNTNIVEYWYSNRNSKPQLAQLSEVVLGVPPTQVSVERLFSCLKFVLSPLRTRLTSEVVNDILVIRMNALYANNEK